ncbi:MerR family transcriptional regulator [Shewanella sp. A3A]|nr:MerR family transcriptional regulator [Shewanella ferrihydritica]
MATEVEYNLPIGEVARLTGVNPVTLRAWQRRFGLVTPQRTPKGHRLYSVEQVEEIKEILHWLEQGVAISRVKPLLKQTTPVVATVEADGDWQQLTEGLTDAVLALKAVTVRQRLDELTSLYPLPLCGEQLLQWLTALDSCLAERVDGPLLRSWLQQQLQHYSALRCESVLRQKHRNLLLLSLGEQPDYHQWLWQLALLAQNIVPHSFSVADNLDVLSLVSERLQPCALLALPAAHTHQSTLEQLDQLAQKLALPVALGGAYAPLLQQAMSELPRLTILAGVTQLAAWPAPAKELQQ